MPRAGTSRRTICSRAAQRTHMLRRRGSARLRFRIEMVERVHQRGAAGEVDMRRVRRGLAGTDLHMHEIKMGRERPRRGQRGREHGAVAIAAAGRDEDRFHGRFTHMGNVG